MSCKRLERKKTRRNSGTPRRDMKGKQEMKRKRGEKGFSCEMSTRTGIFGRRETASEKELPISCTFVYLKSLETMLFQDNTMFEEEKAILCKLKEVFLYTNEEKKKTIEMKPFTGEHAQNMNSQQSLLEYAIEIFRRYLGSQKCSITVLKSAFEEREIENFFAKIKTVTVKARIMIVRCVQILLLKAVEYRYLLKNCIYNELVYYIENGKNLKCIDVLLDICAFYVLKDIYHDMHELRYFLINYVLPLFTNSNAFCYRDDVILLFTSICYCSDSFMDMVFTHFSKIFFETNTPTKTLIMEITLKVLNEKCRDMYPYIPMITEFINFALKEQNSALIVIMKLLFSLPVLFLSLKRNIAHFLPLIFTNLYKTSKNYWNVEERCVLYEIISNIMIIDKDLFDWCLMNYNKERYGAYFDRKINEDVINIDFINAKSRAFDENINERRTSVYDVEYEELKRFKRM
ncbi:Serine/threonine protein phosphatase 2A, regulatory subunit [Trachipleistophora hominis]|uniref:Serine/threonine protein phosphatase 2A, regulatory subunit n=1 Tax=Trachipleistophora hominis TaxID=72359 RepID=L7JZT6_TRAHO|nr:Serine/threonine protein phosphatase 2A, regulatory subunit [Trachipleistophora hominis]